MTNVSTVAVGEIVHVIARRSFDGDLRRHFVGRIVAAEGLSVRLEGYVFAFDISHKELFVKLDEERTRILNLGDSGLIVNVLPRETDVEKVHYVQEADGKLVVTDGKAFSLCMQEFGGRR